MCLLQGFTVSLLLNATNILLCSNETLLDSTGILCGDNTWKNANTIAVQFCDRNYTLNSTIEFVNKTSVHLIGSKQTTILCDSSEENGISFKDTTDVLLHNIAMKGCGFVFNSIKDSIQTYTGIGIINASRVLIENLTLSYSRGTGCFIVDLTDCVSIINSTFEEITSSQYTGFGGLYISTSVSTLDKSSVIITESTFKNNTGSGGVQLSIGTPNTGVLVNNSIFENNQGTFGGGLSVRSSIRMALSNFHILLNNCTFDGNKANYGGGVQLNIGTPNTSVLVTNSIFEKNQGTYEGGGLRVLSSIRMALSNFHVLLNNCTFDRNKANYGGGVQLNLGTPNTSVLVMNSIFENNQGTYEGGGLCVLSSIRMALSSFHVLLNNCIFDRNKANYGGGVQLNIGTLNTSVLVTNSTFENNQGTYEGGGISVQSSIMNSSNLHIQLKYCNFDGNKANYGGGLNMNVVKTPINLCIESSYFIANEAVYGGGIAMYTLKSCRNNNSNMAYFVNTYFYNNTANFSGGGLHIHMPVLFDTTCNYTHLGDAYTIKNCEMKHNNARTGAAIILIFELFSEHNSTCTLENCSFVNNYIKNMNPGTARTASNDLVCNGSVIFKNFILHLKNHTFFTDNYGTALCLESSKMVVENHTTIEFSGNHGDYGGAFALHKLSTLELHSGVHLNFSNNLANLMGGALFITESKYNRYSECFIIVHSYSKGTLTFEANNISNHTDKCDKFGNSIYIYSISMCKNITNFINASEHIMFDFGKASVLCEISTKATLKSDDNSSEPLKFIPGQEQQLPIKVINDFDQNIKNFIEIQINSYDIKLDSSPIIAPHKQIVLNGEPKAMGTILLTMRVTSGTGLDENDRIEFSVELQHCPPGFIILNESSCHCKIHSNYVGLSKCDYKKFQAIITRAYWIGYLEKNNSNDSNLYSSLCPTGFCHRMSNQRLSIPLPQAPNIEEMDNLICGPNRTGFLCAKCRENHSAFFHTESFNCFQDQYCSFGCLFFLLSEILPVTVVFMLVIFFNIQLTSGNVQGFILYAQIFHSLRITANDNNNTMSALRYLQMIYHMLNLEFFTHDKLSFCLLKGATSLDIIAVKYITIAYSLLLVFVVVFLCNKCCTTVRMCGHRTSKTAAVHGLSSFLVLCYSQCTKVSLLLLTPATVYQKSSQYYKRVVFYDGQMDFFKGKHLAYTIPVIMLAFPLIVIPPFLLLAYPLCYKVFAFLHIQESMFLKIVCKIIPLERFRPFFDSFQSSFKDEYRCFAGLYFIYRFLTLLSFAGVQSVTTFYTVVQIQFILMLLLHTWIQPYKKKWHNQLDSYILCTLVMLNSITIFHLCKSFKQEEPNEKTFHFTRIQIGLAYLPILVMLAQYAYSRRSLVKKFWQKLPMNTNILVLGRKCDNEEILLSLQESRDMDLSTSYKKE